MPSFFPILEAPVEKNVLQHVICWTFQGKKTYQLNPTIKASVVENRMHGEPSTETFVTPSCTVALREHCPPWTMHGALLTSTLQKKTYMRSWGHIFSKCLSTFFELEHLMNEKNENLMKNGLRPRCTFHLGKWNWRVGDKCCDILENATVFEVLSHEPQLYHETH